MAFNHKEQIERAEWDVKLIFRQVCRLKIGNIDYEIKERYAWENHELFAQANKFTIHKIPWSEEWVSKSTSKISWSSARHIRV